MGCRGHDLMVVEFKTRYEISSYHHQGCEFESRTDELYSIHQYMIKFVSNLQQVGGFFRVLRFPPVIKPTVTV